MNEPINQIQSIFYLFLFCSTGHVNLEQIARRLKFTNKYKMKPIWRVKIRKKP